MSLRGQFQAGADRYDYFSLAAADGGRGSVARLPYTLRILLENLLRHRAEGLTNDDEIAALVEWPGRRASAREFSFRPARVLMPDSTGIPFLGDMAAMRDAMRRLGGDPTRINPVIPVDFVVDHSVMADDHGNPRAMARNMALEFDQNRERYEFLRWGSRAFDNLRVIPPGNGICHQINLEYLADVVSVRTEADGTKLAYPDSLVGMDSHTSMINSLGIVGWGVGGIEGATAALGEPVSVTVEEVVGCRFSGKLAPGATSTDLVLTVTEIMRRQKVVGSIIEYFGPGLDGMPLPERATIANMTPEFGATMGFFPVDAETLRYLSTTGRSARAELVATYCRAQGLLREAGAPVPEYTRVVEIDLGSVRPCMAGPRYPHERVALQEVPSAFRSAYTGKPEERRARTEERTPKNGDVVIAAITSCTNTSNPSVMIGAGLLARNARARGLKKKPWVKASFSPGSRVVVDYLERSGLQRSLDELGFNLVGLGCMTCMGNSGPLPPDVAAAVEKEGVAAAAVLSGNRNFEGRIHPQVRANYLASPPLVVAYALAGSVSADLLREPLGNDDAGHPVYLKDIWPDDDEIRSVADRFIEAGLFGLHRGKLLEGGPDWQGLEAGGGGLYAWNAASTFIRRPPFFDEMTAAPSPLRDIRGARVLAMFGDMVTTDHISPIGTILPSTSAGRYLQSLGIAPKDFVNYGARRLNHDVMMRGAFANVRIRNEMTQGIEGGYTRHFPAGERMTIYDAAMRYRESGTPLVVVAGQNYGAGSSRDWAAKGPRLLGVSALIAESFERIHRSNLVGMGLLPLQFAAGVTRRTLELDGTETFDLRGIEGLRGGSREIECRITRADGRREIIALMARIDAPQEVDYLLHGGILHYALRRRITQGAASS